jgi:DNA polymerase III subunit epsilon
MRQVKGTSFANLDRAIVFDVETTGLTPKSHRIVSIAALKVDFNHLLRTGDSPTGTYQSVINPERKIPADASAIHGLYKEDVEGRGNFEAHAAQIIEFIEDLPLIAHNCEFDASFLYESFFRIGLSEVMARPLFCTMKRACHHMSKAGNPRYRVSLADACLFFSVPFDRRSVHEPLEDAIAALKLAATFVSVDRS